MFKYVKYFKSICFSSVTTLSCAHKFIHSSTPGGFRRANPLTSMCMKGRRQLKNTEKHMQAWGEHVKLHRQQPSCCSCNISESIIYQKRYGTEKLSEAQIQIYIQHPQFFGLYQSYKKLRLYSFRHLCFWF